ncbi:hypothetical protein CMO88_04565 [Candidatus Woesearchaeota archaeon]|nr:hypothetical protein [Candidatus Woesearchaeota archaeon]|tara:strand:+ start:1928 stop:2524 length:597 start_codon:yes stop_codon:yes gene_type:complete
MVTRKEQFRKAGAILLSWLGSHKRLVSLVIALLFVLIVFIDIIIPATIIITLGIIATFSTSYKRFIRMPPALELITFTTVMVSLAYGPVMGAIYGAVVSFTAEILTNALDVFIIKFVPTRAFIGLVAGFVFDLLNGNIVFTGLALTILYNGITQPLDLLLADVEVRLKSIYFFILNVGFNFIIFAILGKIMISLLGIS